MSRRTEVAPGHRPWRDTFCPVSCRRPAGLLAGDGPRWLGWVVLGADVLFAAAYVRFRDIPPFVFYLLLVVVGVTVL